MIGHHPPEGFYGIIVYVVVERQVVHIAIRLGHRKIDVENDFVGNAVDVPEVVLDTVIYFPHRHTAAYTGLPVETLHVVAVEVFTPMGQLAQCVGDGFHDSHLYGPIEFLSGDQPLAAAAECCRP